MSIFRGKYSIDIIPDFPHETDAVVEWLPTYEYDAKHRNPIENDFECPMPCCGYAAHHRKKGERNEHRRRP